MLTYEYDYDANGNRVAYTGPEGTVAATYDAQDRLLTYGSNSYTYNDHGQLTSKTDAGGTTSYNYDELGNLLSVTLPDSTLIEYIIDALGRRVGKKVNGALVRQWTYQDRLNPVAEYDGSGTLIQQFVYATRMNVPDLIIRGGTTYRVIADQVGSVRRIVEVSTGAIVQEMTYSPFGKVLSDSSPGWQPFAFAGGLYDGDTGLVRFGARDYDAEVGRWTAKDPIGFDGGANHYAYARNNPVSFFDRTGLETEVIFWEPVGRGASSFGHVSVNINGTTYTYGPTAGMDQLKTSKYIERNTKFRSGRGLLLSLPAEEEAALERYLASHPDFQGPDNYNAVSNNCADPLEDWISDQQLFGGPNGYDWPVQAGDALLPTGFAKKLEEAAIGQTFYPGPPRPAGSVPWSTAASGSFWNMY